MFYDNRDNYSEYDVFVLNLIVAVHASKQHLSYHLRIFLIIECHEGDNWSQQSDV